MTPTTITFHTERWTWLKRLAFAFCILFARPVRVIGDICHCDTTAGQFCHKCDRLRHVTWKDIPV